MKKILIVLALITINLNAQISKVDGPIAESKGKHDLQSIIGADNNAFYVYRREDDKIFVQRYNKTKLTKEWETDISPKDKSIEILDWHNKKMFYLKGGKIYLFIPAGTKKKTLLLLRVLGADGKIDGEAQEIYSSDDENVTDKYKKYVIQYKYSVSTDSSKMIYWFSYFISGKMYKGNGETITKTAMIDLKNLKKLSAAIPAKYEANDIIPGNFAISNDGLVAFDFVYYIADKSLIHNASEDYPHYTIGMYNPSTSAFKAIVPNFGTGAKKFGGIAGVNFTSGNKFMACLITTDIQGNGIKRKNQNCGIYLGLFDAAKNTAEKETFQYFSQAWRDKYLSKDKDNPIDDRWNSASYDFKITPVDAGNYIISAFNATVGTEAGWGKYVWYSSARDGMIFKVNSLGGIEWNKILPMNLSSIYTETYINYTYSNKKMFYFFDDNTDNEKDVDLANIETSKDTKKTKDIDGKDVNTVCITYDMTGKAERIIIQNNKEAGLYPLDKTVFLEKNKILLYFKKGTKEHFSVLTLP